MFIYKFLYRHMFSAFLDMCLGVELLGYMVTLFNISRNYQTVFQRGCTILHSHQQCTRVPVSPYLQHLLLSVLFIVAVFMGMKWYLIIVSIWISLMTHNHSFAQKSCQFFSQNSLKHSNTLGTKVNPYLSWSSLSLISCHCTSPILCSSHWAQYKIIFCSLFRFFSVDNALLEGEYLTFIQYKFPLTLPPKWLCDLSSLLCPTFLLLYFFWGFFCWLFFGHATRMQDLSSPTRNQTHAPCSGSAVS